MLAARKPDSVVWGSLWPASPLATVEFELDQAPEGGTRMVRRWWSDQPRDARGIGIVRFRLNHAFGSSLRDAFGQNGMPPPRA